MFSNQQLHVPSSPDVLIVDSFQDNILNLENNINTWLLFYCVGLCLKLFMLQEAVL